jgi:hypothetical protein
VRRLFQVFVSASTVAGIFVFSTSVIAEVKLRNLPLYHELPLAFWVGLVALLGATLVWWYSRETTYEHFWLVALWTAYVFIIPELLETGLRGLDLQTGSIQYLKAKVGPETWLYANFPGFFLQFAAVQEVLGLDHTALNRLAAVVLHVARTLIVVILGRSLCGSLKKTLLFSLVVLTLLWVPLRLDPVPQNMGFILFLLLLFLLRRSSQKFHIPLVVTYLASVITHPLSAIAVLLVAVPAVLITHSKNGVGTSEGNPLGRLFPNARFATCVVLAMMLGAWFLTGAQPTFATATHNFTAFVRDPLRSAPFFTVVSEFRGYVFRLAFLFYLCLSAWVLVAAVKAWRAFDLDRANYFVYTLPLGLIFATGFYGWESTDRIQLFAAPFVAVFLATEKNSSKAAIVFLLPLVMLAFANRYSQEYNQFIPVHEIRGAEFVVEEVPPTETVFIGKRWSPSLGDIAGSPLRQPLQVDYLDLRHDEPGKGFRYAGFAPRWENLILFYFGPIAWAEVREKVYSRARTAVYTNGKFEVSTFR